MDSQGYGFHATLPYGMPQNGAYAAASATASTSGSNFYPGVAYPPPAANPTVITQTRQPHLPPQTASAMHPPASAAIPTPQLQDSIPTSLFFNVGGSSSQLWDIYPTPNGIRHASFFEDGSVKDQAEKLLGGPSHVLVDALTDHLSQTVTHAVTFRKPVDPPPVPNNQNGPLSVPKQAPLSSLQRHMQLLEPAVFVPNSVPTRRSRRNNPTAVESPLAMDTRTVSLNGLNPPEWSRADHSVITTNTAQIEPLPVGPPGPPIKLKLSTKFARDSASSEPAPKKMKPPPQTVASPMVHSPEMHVAPMHMPPPATQPPRSQPKIVVVLPVSKKDKQLNRVRDENLNCMDLAPSSPEIPVKPPQVPPKPTIEIKPEEKSDPLCAMGDVFDPSKLTIKISRVSVDTAVAAFFDSINGVEVKSTHRAASSSGAPRRTTNVSTSHARDHHEPEIPFSLDSSGENLALQSFAKTAGKVLERVGECDISHLVLGNMDKEITDADIPVESVIKPSLSRKLVEDAAKLKAHDLTRHVPMETLKNLLVGLLPTILRGYIVAPEKMQFMQELDESDSAYQDLRDGLNNQYLLGAEAAVAALSIMTSPKMPKEIFNPDVFQPCIRLTSHHLHDTIYPAFDPLYSCQAQAKDGFVAKIKQKRARAGGGSRDDTMLKLYSRFEDLALLFADVVAGQALDEGPLFSLASMGVSAFFVENVRDLQLKSLRLVANIFSRYEKLRDAICEDILSSLARLPSSKRNLRNYVVSGKGENIQMISALLLHLIQSIPKVPTKRQLAHRGDAKGADFETTILLSYDESTRCSKSILTAFFTKCASKGDEDYRPLFENFIVDLLTTLGRPEWPAAESLLCILCVVLLQKSNDKTLDANFRYASIDYLGLITSRMRKDSISIRENPSQLQDLVSKLYQTFSLTDDGMLEVDTSDIPNEKHLFGQALLHYLWHSVPAPSFAANYYLVQWYHDSVNDSSESVNTEDDEVEQRRIAPSEREQTKAGILDFMKTAAELTRKPTSGGRQLVDSPSAKLVARHFASKRQFSTSFESYFRRILGMASDNATQIRIRAIKSVSTIIDADSSLMGRDDVKNCVESRLLDTSASIRETAIEMIGKYSVLHPKHLSQYHQILLKRLMDTAPSVRKRAIKVLHDFCVEWPENDLCVPICSNIIKRIGDEEAVKKLVYEVFQSTWFDAKSIKDSSAMAKRVGQILQVIGMLANEPVPATDWFDRMLKDLLKRESEQKHKPVRQACKAIAEQIFKQLLDSTEADAEAADRSSNESTQTEKSLLALSLLANCLPEVVMPHAQSLPPYLNQSIARKSDQTTISLAANILSTVVPLLKNPPDLFMAQIEESCAAVFVKQNVNVQLLQDNIECLAAVVNNVTFNYKIVRDLFERFWRMLLEGSGKHGAEPGMVTRLHRSLCIVALIVQHFDIESEAFGYTGNIKDRLVDVFVSLLKHPNATVHSKALQSLGFIFIRKPETMLQQKIASIYSSLLSPTNENVEMKQIVLANLVRYVEHEESMVADIEEHTTAQEQYASLDLRGNQTGTAELPRKIIYHYLKSILICGLDAELDIRREVLNLISAVVRLRFSSPQLLIPYLMAAATEPYEQQSTKADILLEEINRKYHGSVSTKALDGVKESFTFQKVIKPPTSVVRGSRPNLQQGSGPVSLVGTVYSLLRSDRNHRRALITSLLSTFKYEDSRLDQLLYFADNLAYFAYNTQDEPLFVMYQIEPIMAMICPDALHRFRKAFKLSIPSTGTEEEDAYDEDELETPDNLRKSMPDDLADLRRCYRLCQPSFLLIGLKKFLENYYGFTAARLKEYSPSEKQAVWEKPIVSRKQAVKFQPGIVVEFVSKELKGTLDEFLSADFLVKKFLDFKAVVSTIDDVVAEQESGRPVEDDDEEDAHGHEEGQFPLDDTEDTEGVAAEAPSGSCSTPVKKRGRDGTFKQPKTSRKKADPSTPRRTRGRPRKTPVKERRGRSSSDEDDSSIA